jgi:hypothetical protein
MSSLRLLRSFVVAAFVAVALLAVARAADETTTIKFSDPAKPGTLKINVNAGELRLEGADVNEITVRSDARPANRTTRADGLRVLTDASSFSLSEKDNVVTLSSLDHVGRGSEFKITVPRNTAIVLRNTFGGEISCSGIAGDLEIHSVNGEIVLNDITGGAVVENVNGEINASIRTLAANKPLSFTSMNGEIVLRVPNDAKANVRLRTQNGSVLTDFDETALVTKTESALRTGRRNSRALPPEAAEAIREATRMAAQAGREAAEAAREGLEAAREGLEAARRTAEAAHAQAEQSRSATHNGVTVNPAPPVPPVPPLPPVLPTITGGKLITGTLNGGGPEINVATLNGDVTLRKLQVGASAK